MIYILILITVLINKITVPEMKKKRNKTKTWQVGFSKETWSKELYITVVAVVEVVALFQDCFQQTVKWSFNVCK